MCGLVGIYSGLNQLATSHDTLIAMRDSIIHRGPDAAGIWQSPEKNCLLGHRRLSILDLSENAAQPMATPDGNVSIVFNGEIYNHLEIRKELSEQCNIAWKSDHSDTEMILHAYNTWGLNAVNKFHGMFSLVIFDRRDPSNPCLHMIRDRAGIKPLYFTKTPNGEWVFGSEIKALLKHPNITRQISKTALSHYLTFIVAPAPLTMFKDIWKIPAGYSITIDKNNNAIGKQWWDCKPSFATTYSEKTLPYSDAKDKLHDLLLKSIERRMVSDVPFGVLLSGGVDSSLNVALMSQLMDRPVTTFSVGYKGHDELNEFKYARKIAKRYSTEHHEVQINESDALNFIPDLIRYQDEPIADNVCIPLYFLSKLVKDSGTTVVQVGEGADENFLGYWWCQDYINKLSVANKNASYSSQAKRWIINRMRSSLGRPVAADDEILKRVKNGKELFWGGAACWFGSMRENLTPTLSNFSESLNCPVSGILPQSFIELDSHEVVSYYLSQLEALDSPDIYQKIPYLEMKNRLPEHLLMRVDKMTMAHSIEARVPFLDHELVEFAMKLPLSYKINNGIGKYILKQVAEPYVDHDLLYRKKQGFGAPMESWFKQSQFVTFCRHAIENSALISEFFDKQYLLNMLKNQSTTGGGYSFHLWTVLNVVLWYDYWIDDTFDWFTTGGI